MHGAREEVLSALAAEMADSDAGPGGPAWPESPAIKAWRGAGPGVAAGGSPGRPAARGGHLAVGT